MSYFFKAVYNFKGTFYFLILILVFELPACKVNRKISKIDEAGNGRINNVFDLTCLSKPITDLKIYSKNIDVGKLEAFDIDSHGNIFYARLGDLNKKIKGKDIAHEVFIYKAKPNQKPQEYMTLKYFGHPYNISIEEDRGETFLWISSNGSKHNTGKYWDERSVSRIKYEAGKIYDKGYGGETFFLNNNELKTQVAINKENDLICIASEKGKDWSFYIYKLSQVKALPDTTFTFKVTIGGEEIGSKEQTIIKRVKGHDLSRLTPLGTFTVPGDRENKPGGLNSFWMQGFSIDKNGYVYFYEGEGNRQGRLARAYLTILDIHGNIIGSRTKVEAISNSKELDKAGIINNRGNLEPEGMAIRGDYIYLGFLSHKVGSNKKGRKANIFQYKIHY